MSKAPLAQDAACKICRGQGVELTFTDTTPYNSHIRTVHPDSLPASAVGAQYVETFTNSDVPMSDALKAALGQ